jgi:hypothetical protein
VIARTTLVAALSLYLAACTQKTEHAPELVKSARFGVFFGGQIEERREIAFELDAAKQTQGFRVEFGEPLAADVDVEWHIDEPQAPVAHAARRRRHALVPPAAPSARTLSSHATIHAGETRFEHLVGFEPGDPLGTWHVKVTVAGKLAIDRPFDVYDRAEREHATDLDAGM